MQIVILIKVIIIKDTLFLQLNAYPVVFIESSGSDIRLKEKQYWASVVSGGQKGWLVQT